MAVSAKGFEGLGPVFRVDATLDTHGTPQAQNGKVGFSNGSGMISHGRLYIPCCFAKGRRHYTLF